MTNIAFHAANALLVLAIARAVAGLSLIASTYAALVFAILPLHAESVVWITGRVDTIPAVFFLGSFLAYARWRRARREIDAALPLLACPVLLRALQQTEHDRHGGDIVPVRSRGRTAADPRVMVVAGAVRALRRALTIAYLVLRYALFGEVAREGQLTADGLGVSRIFVGKHFQRMFFGGEVARYPFGYIAALLVTAGAWFLARSSAAANLRHAPAMVLSSARAGGFSALPLSWSWAMSRPATCISPSVGWAILLGLVFHIIWHGRHAALRYATLVASVGVLVFYAAGLQAEVADWNTGRAFRRKWSPTSSVRHSRRPKEAC